MDRTSTEQGPGPSDPWVSIVELAAAVSRSPRTIERWIREEGLGQLIDGKKRVRQSAAIRLAEKKNATYQPPGGAEVRRLPIPDATSIKEGLAVVGDPDQRQVEVLGAALEAVTRELQAERAQHRDERNRLLTERDQYQDEASRLQTELVRLQVQLAQYE